VIDNGTPTNAVEVLDLAILLPGLILTVIGLIQKNPLSYVLAPALLAFSLFLGLALMSMAVFMVRAGLASDLSLVIIFGIISLPNLVLLTWYLKDLRQTQSV
jgi:hypothetical protein